MIDSADKSGDSREKKNKINFNRSALVFSFLSGNRFACVPPEKKKTLKQAPETNASAPLLEIASVSQLHHANCPRRCVKALNLGGWRTVFYYCFSAGVSGAWNARASLFKRSSTRWGRETVRRRDIYGRKSAARTLCGVPAVASSAA